MTNKEKLKKYESICLDVIQKEAIQIGTYTIELTNENGSWWGRCDTYPDGTCKIYIKEDLFGADLDKSFALAIIGHELLHTSPKMKNHNRKFKKSAEKLFKNGIYANMIFAEPISNHQKEAYVAHCSCGFHHFFTPIKGRTKCLVCEKTIRFAWNECFCEDEKLEVVSYKKSPHVE